MKVIQRGEKMKFDKKRIMESLEENRMEEIKQFLIEDENGNDTIKHRLFEDLIHRYVEVSKNFQEKIEEITILSETDYLTKIYNRRKFVELLESETARYKRNSKPFSVVMFDIDHFKKINDKYGHNIGDVILEKVAFETKQLLREYDYAARWGGEEFIVLLPETDVEQAYYAAERIRDMITKLIFEGFSVSASFGVAEYKNGENIDYLIKRADDKMYMAKAGGRNRVKYL